MLLEPIVQIAFTLLYKEAGFSSAEFEIVSKEIKIIRDRYNQRIAPSLDYLFRYRFHHIFNNQKNCCKYRNTKK